jgi:hypothetical protein
LTIADFFELFVPFVVRTPKTMPIGESEDSYFGDFIEDDAVDSPVASATQEMLKGRIDIVLEFN